MHRLTAFVAFDLETTGLSTESDSLIEIGAVRVENGVLGERFSCVVKPRTSVSTLARHLTGILPEEMEAGLEPAAALTAFLEFAGDWPWVAHNAEFDLTFLQAECERAGLNKPQPRCYDSLWMARMAWPQWPNHKLETVATRLALPEGRGHRALPDAEWAALAFVQAENELARRTEDQPVWQALLPQVPEPWCLLAEGEQGSAPETWVGTPVRKVLPAPGEAPGEAFFKADGPLDLATRARVLPGTPWPDRWYADMRRALAEGRPASLECSDRRAPALILAAAVAKSLKTDKPVMVVVPDARAEEQVMGAALTDVRTALGEGFTVTVLREPDGYLSTTRLRALLPRFDRLFTPTERLQMLPVLAWARTSSTGDLLSFPGVAADRSRTLGLKLAASGFAPDEIFAHTALRAAENAQVVVVRSETFYRDLELDGALIPACEGVVFCDAQRLPEASEMAFGREFHFFKLRHVLQWIGVSEEEPFGLSAWLGSIMAELPKDAPFEEAIQAAVSGLLDKALQADKAAQKWLSKLGRQAEKRVKAGESRFRYREKLAIELACPETPVHEAIEALQADLTAIATALETRSDAAYAPYRNEGVQAAQECRKCASRLGEMRTLISRIADPQAEEVAWMEDFQNPHKIRLRLRPLHAGKLFAAKFSTLHRGGVFIGASLSLGDGTQKHFAHRLGLDHFEAKVRVGSEAPPAKERLGLLMPFAPAPQGADSAKHLAELLARLLAPVQVPVTLFAPSHTVIKALREGLSSHLPERMIIAQGVDGQRENLTFLFRQARNPILLAQDWPVDLVDAEGRPPGLWILSRIPFAPPSDAMVAARSEIIQQEGRHPLFEWLVPEAATRIKDWMQKQRRTGQKVVVWLADPRLARERYGAFMTRALTQDMKTCAKEDEVAAATLEWLQS